MNRRQFIKRAGVIGGAVGALGLVGWSQWPQASVLNPCRAGLPSEITQHPLMSQIWAGLDPSKVWDVHTHLVGVGDSNSGAWANPKMNSMWNPLQYIQKVFYMNAGCVHDAPGQIDASFVARIENLMDGFPLGAQILLYAFDWAHNEAGESLRDISAFYVPNAYASKIAQAHPTRIQWAASIHPYRKDALDALDYAVANGARAMKWLPAAMGINPDSPKCDKFYQLLAKHDLPLITHAGHEAAVAGSAQQGFGNPLKVRRALDFGVRVVVAHCASHGDDLDHVGKKRPSFNILADMLDAKISGNFDKLYADISAVTQFNRANVLQTLLTKPEWHPRLLNGSDYPLPGILPLTSLGKLVKLQLLDVSTLPFLTSLREHNPLLFDFALKRLLRSGGVGFANSVFETQDFFVKTRL